MINTLQAEQYCSNEIMDAVRKLIAFSQPTKINHDNFSINWRAQEQIWVKIASHGLIPDEDYYTIRSKYFNEDELTSHWITSEGKLTKRVSKWFFKNYGIKLSDAILSEIGNICYQNMLAREMQYFDIASEKIDWYPGDFGDDGSCLWDRGGVRLMNNSNCYLAIRTYNSGLKGHGRAWLCVKPRAIILFNGYSTDTSHYDIISTKQFAQLLSELLECKNRTVEIFHEGECDSDEFYINNRGVGFQLYFDESHPYNQIDVDTRDYDFSEEVQDKADAWCYHCDDAIVYERDDYYAFDNGRIVCQSCLEDRYTYCNGCEDYIYDNTTQFHTHNDENLCDYCYKNLDCIVTCLRCDWTIDTCEEEYFPTKDGWLCNNCLTSGMVQCESCCDWTDYSWAPHEDDFLCPSCGSIIVEGEKIDPINDFQSDKYIPFSERTVVTSAQLMLF